MATTALVVTGHAAARSPGRPMLPPHPTARYLPFDGSDCTSGNPVCIRQTTAEMYRRVNSVVAVCDHRAVFALGYVRVNEELDARVHAGRFADAGWLARVDRGFSLLYFNAFDAWAAGRPDAVPAAWRLGFAAAERRELTAIGNFFAEANAHINRDLPMLLSAIGTTAPDGTSHKPDFDLVMDTITTRQQPLLAEIVERFDPTADDLAVSPFTDAVPAMLAEWRENAWRNAERLIAAPTPEDRAVVAAEIEQAAEASGRAIVESLRSRVPGAAPARDAWCAQHGGQRPFAYQPGAAALTLRRKAVRVPPDGRALLVVTCPAPSLGCRGTIAILRNGRALGRTRYRLRAGTTRTLRVLVGRDVARRRTSRATARLTRSGVPGSAAVLSVAVRLTGAPS